MKLSQNLSKAFTTVELLATLTITGSLITATVVGVPTLVAYAQGGAHKVNWIVNYQAKEAALNGAGYLLGVTNCPIDVSVDTNGVVTETDSSAGTTTVLYDPAQTNQLDQVPNQ